MIPLIVIRPEPGGAGTVTAARALGMDALGFPLFTVTPQRWDAPDAAGFDALLIGSANALRHAGGALAHYRHLPTYAVGEKTAEACRAAGLSVARSGSGGLQGVLDQLDPAHRRLLRLGGRETVALTPPPGVTMIARTVYASDPQPVPPALAQHLAAPCVVMLHSAEAARHFAAECTRLGLSRAAITLALIGPRLLDAAGSGWAAAVCAETPAEAPLLALAQRLCQEGSGSDGIVETLGKQPDAG
jgi:uroporphyrinogen-III synthase